MKRFLWASAAILMLVPASAWAQYGDPAGLVPEGAAAAPGSPPGVPADMPASSSSYRGIRPHHVELKKAHRKAHRHKLDKKPGAEQAPGK